MSPLEEYKQLYIEYDKVIWAPNWEDNIGVLNEKMDKLWPKLSALDRNKAIQFCGELYWKRMKYDS